MKTFFKLFLLLALTVYLIFAFTHIASGKDESVCKAISVNVSDSSHAGFITANEVERLITSAQLNPVGKKMDDINSEAIEKALLKNPFIKFAKCYKTGGGELSVHVTQRLPILRVMANNGDNYYIDSNGQVMNPQGYSADLIVATGDINRHFAGKKLLPIAKKINDNSFADDLITQIDVTPKGEIDLVPRIGCDIIHLGKTDTIQIGQQLAHLQTFYTKVLPTVGWDTYREINLEYSNQIVCKKHASGKKRS